MKISARRTTVGYRSLHAKQFARSVSIPECFNQGSEARLPKPARDHSVERRNSGALSDFADSDLADSDFVSDLTGSILALSTRGVSTRADASTDPVRSGGASERGWTTARAISICAAP